MWYGVFNLKTISFMVKYFLMAQDMYQWFKERINWYYVSPTYCLCTGVCETGYKGDNCDQCDTGYYGDGATCTTCGTHKTTPATGTAATAVDCKFTLLSNST